ncbi:hypothetical protein [Nocardia carnea]|uniref:hypothetical protein n=1 Tax=Nocardia carnea TaxID=37328 RepID=UPI0024564F1F|nr:hypothetical protein [Nocardia carnea]
MALTVFGLVVFAVSLVGVVALLGALSWYSGGRILRVLGLLLIFSNAYRLLLAVFVPWVLGSALRWLAVGLVLWLVGHWVHFRRVGVPRSALAARVFALPGLRAIVPAAAPVPEPPHE